MWLCRNCRHEFETPSIWDGDGFSGRYGICPICGHDDIVELVECVDCGREFDPAEMTGPLCESCYDAAIRGYAADYISETDQKKDFAEWYAAL